MATRMFVGAAAKVAQVSTSTPGGTIAATDVFTITINNKSISFVATATTVAHVVTGLYNAWIASQEPEFQEITPTDSTTTLTMTHNTPGVPFTVASSIVNTSGGAAPTLTDATTTAASGPTFANVAANWSGATLPVDSDTIIFEGSFNITDGLDNSSVTPARVIVRDFNGTFGRPPINAGGYPEYREQYLKYGASADAVTINVDLFQNTTSGLMRLCTNDAQTVINVYETGRPATTTGLARIKAFTWYGSHASNVVNIAAGSVGIATEAGETAVVATGRIGPGTVGGFLDVELGIGLTATTFTHLGGQAVAYNDIGTLTVDGSQAVMTLWDDADITTALNVQNGATVYPNGTMTMAATLVANDGRIMMDADSRALTYSGTVTVEKDGVFYDPFGRATLNGTPDIQLGGGASLETVRINLGTGHALNKA